MTQEPYTANLWALTKTEFRGKFIISNQYIGKSGENQWTKNMERAMGHSSCLGF